MSFRPKIKNKIIAVLFAILPAFVVGSLVIGANVYYDLDSNTVRTFENSAITGSFSVTGNSTLATDASTTNTFGSGASSVNTIGSVTTPGALTLHGATSLDNTFDLTYSGASTAFTVTQSGTGSIINLVNTTSATSAAFTLTNLGSGNSLVVNDIASDTTPFVIDAAGNVGIGTTDLTGSKFKISLDDSSSDITDLYNDQSKIASAGDTNVLSGKLQLLGCGLYSVVGIDSVTYGTVLGADGKCWLDRNLGATQVATSSADDASYGWYYQWGRLFDGHQIGTSGTTSTNSSGDVPGHANFITEASSPYDWRVPQNDSLWQGVSGVNNPCPTGWRLPTQTEWASLVSAASITNSATAYSSSLKLPVAGVRFSSSAALINQGSSGNYWSSSPNGADAYLLYFVASSVYPAISDYRAIGFSVRCVKD